MTNRCLFIPDTHRPFQDQRAYDLMLKVAQDYKPHQIIVMGDYADFYWASSHGKNPAIVESFSYKKEIDSVNQGLEELLDLFPEAHHVFIEGNHEYRLARYLQKHAPEIYQSIGIPDVLNLKGWEFVPYGPGQLYQVANSQLYTRHEPYGSGVHFAHQTLVKGGISMVVGHIHRIQEHQAVNAQGLNLRCFGIGWLGDKNHPVMQYVRYHPQWALGFGICDIVADGNFYFRTIHIDNDYRCMADGWLYEG